MHFTLGDVAAATDGTVIGDPRIAVAGAAIDSRDLVTGSLFVPIVAERDGHDFITDATTAGAVAHLTERHDDAGPGVLVGDTTAALQDLGRAARARVRGPVIGITGSVGKTTTKDLLLGILAAVRPTHASRRSFNNELGVPLTLVQAPDDTEVVIVEMGARGIGHIADLCRIATPDIGVVTCVGAAHTELFGDVEQVASAKGELVEALPEAGTAILNHDDPRVAAMAGRTRASVVTFGIGPADVSAARIQLDERLRASFDLLTPMGSQSVRLASAGRHSVVNALAAAAAALATGATVEQVATGLEAAVISPWRMELTTLASGAVVLNDSYNANPMSMEAALDALLAIPADRHIAVLGVMAELGAEHEEAHRAIGDRAAAEGIDVLAVEVTEYGGHLVADAEAALAVLAEQGTPRAGDAVLVKGSRVAGLDRVASALLAGDPQPG